MIFLAADAQKTWHNRFSSHIIRLAEASEQRELSLKPAQIDGYRYYYVEQIDGYHVVGDGPDEYVSLFEKKGRKGVLEKG
ncbi:hypothetical protein CEXT_288791 [Caerostris extrusa]|uniref:Uncharacterized protein n=1 Tax=Caerostris extrusa TaxID=172846 RepID=A0AAV4VBR7_CAEEX|nr:hypothetical protein CEXT_288791 [Caerostris extrusa]